MKKVWKLSGVRYMKDVDCVESVMCYILLI